MENKKTTELMSRKSTLKSKLMAAVSMLLVSAIMVSVTTYAWFILSTAPEVRGMSTTVGSNGALEMALLNTETGANMDKIKAGVGDSIATSGNVTASNITWGNLVDLEDTSYGLDQITLYPAQLSGLTGLLRSASTLSYAVYGTDGRVANLDGMTESGVRDKDGSFIADSDSYGVRAIGQAIGANPIKKNFSDAVTAYNTNSKNAVNNANAAFSTDNLKALLSAAQNVYYLDKNDKAKDYTDATTGTILPVLKSLNTAVEDMQLAVKSAIAAEQNSKATSAEDQIAKADIKNIDLNNDQYKNSALYGTIISDLNKLHDSLSEKISEAESYIPDEEHQNRKVTYDQFRPLIEALMGVDGSTSNPDNTKMVFELKDKDGQLIKNGDSDTWSITDGKKLLDVSDQIKSLIAKIRYGLYKDMADITGSMETQIEYNNIPGTATVTAKDKADKIEIDKAVKALKEPAGEGQAQAYIDNYYGYAIDLAFRTNASNNKLKLSTEAKSRVSGNEVMGAGSTFTFGKDVAVDDAVVNALRVAFVDADGNVKGVAKLDKTAVADNAKQYALKMYAVTKLENGVLTFGAQTDEIMALPQSKAAMLTAIVYMDGTDLDNTVATGVTGKLNLQFCGSVDLTAMDYSGYNKGISLDGAVSTLEVGATSGTITAKFNGADLTSPAKFAWASSSKKVTVTATGETMNTATITTAEGAVAGDEATITVSYGNYSKTFTVRVIAAATP